MKDKVMEKITASLPYGVRSELVRLALGRGGLDGLSELKLRAGGASSAVISGERVRLYSRAEPRDISAALELLTDGAVYSYRDTVSRGYISLGAGVRVGICGSAGYDGGTLVGISDPSALVFRIPTGEFDCRGELLSEFDRCKRGMLIYSPPGVGKTSALRSLARDLGERGDEVAVVDERREFIESDYRFAAVDILKGYKRADGIEIALRTLSPSVIIVDEVGRLAEAEAMREALSSGVRVAVTAHAADADEVMRRPSLRPFIEGGIVDILVGIEKGEGRRSLRISRTTEFSE